jgi:hypothetical protein
MITGQRTMRKLSIANFSRADSKRIGLGGVYSLEAIKFALTRKVISGLAASTSVITSRPTSQVEKLIAPRAALMLIGERSLYVTSRAKT